MDRQHANAAGAAGRGGERRLIEVSGPTKRFGSKIAVDQLTFTVAPL